MSTRPAVTSLSNGYGQARFFGFTMADAGESFFAAVRREVHARVHTGVADCVRIVPAELGNRAGLIGAALECAQQLQEPTG